jgi:hypothetical protein
MIAIQAKEHRTIGTPIVSGILWLTAVHMTVCAAIFVYWRIGGENAKIELFFKYQGSLFFLICAAAEVCLAWTAFRQFSRGEAMRIAWLLIAFASFYRLIGTVFSKILNTESYLNPIFLLLGAREKSFYLACERVGLLIGGPLSMAVLAAGLFVVLRVLRRVGILSRLRLPDYFLITAVAAFTIRQASEIINWIRITPPPYDAYKVLGWASDPLLSVLLFEAILIRRSALETGWGLLAKSWGAFSLGIFLTSLGDIGLWATAHNYLPWPYNSVTWYVWFLASAAYALGPAYQVEACRLAFREAVTIHTSTPASVS